MVFNEQYITPLLTTSKQCILTVVHHSHVIYCQCKTLFCHFLIMLQKRFRHTKLFQSPHYVEHCTWPCNSIHTYVYDASPTNIHLSSLSLCLLRFITFDSKNPSGCLGSLLSEELDLLFCGIFMVNLPCCKGLVSYKEKKAWNIKNTLDMFWTVYLLGYRRWRYHYTAISMTRFYLSVLGQWNASLHKQNTHAVVQSRNILERKQRVRTCN